ncbi:hypothetical protein INR49_017521, partial [Caranx melampygus]
MPRSTVHRIVHRVTEEVVAIRHPLITPYKRPVQGVAAQHFNSHHSRARSIIERAFGMMKTRFRAIFLQALEVQHTFVPQVITACAVLHNICLGAGDIMAPEDEEQDDMPEDEGENGLEAASGAPWRDQLSAEVSALEEGTWKPSIESALQTPMYDVVDSGDMHPPPPTPQMMSHSQPEDSKVFNVASHPVQQHQQGLLLCQTVYEFSVNTSLCNRMSSLINSKISSLSLLLYLLLALNGPGCLSSSSSSSSSSCCSPTAAPGP